jgi:hypothetical protein
VCDGCDQVAVGHTDGSGSIVSPARGDILTAFEPLPTSPSGQELGGHGETPHLSPHALLSGSLLTNPLSCPDLWKFRNRQLDVRVDDLEACLDTLHRWNSDSESPFYGTVSQHTRHTRHTHDTR